MFETRKADTYGLNFIKPTLGPFHTTLPYPISFVSESIYLYYLNLLKLLISYPIQVVSTAD